MNVSKRQYKDLADEYERIYRGYLDQFGSKTKAKRFLKKDLPEAAKMVKIAMEVRRGSRPNCEEAVLGDMYIERGRRVTREWNKRRKAPVMSEQKQKPLMKAKAQNSNGDIPGSILKAAEILANAGMAKDAADLISPYLSGHITETVPKWKDKYFGTVEPSGTNGRRIKSKHIITSALGKEYSFSSVELTEKVASRVTDLINEVLYLLKVDEQIAKITNAQT
jgi:hypothetical protein